MQQANVLAKLSLNEIFNLKAKNKPVVVYVFGAYLDVRYNTRVSVHHCTVLPPRSSLGNCNREGKV